MQFCGLHRVGERDVLWNCLVCCVLNVTAPLELKALVKLPCPPSVGEAGVQGDERRRCVCGNCCLPNSPLAILFLCEEFPFCHTRHRVMGGVEKEGAQHQGDAAPHFGQWCVSTGMGVQLEQVAAVLWAVGFSPPSVCAAPKLSVGCRTWDAQWDADNSQEQGQLGLCPIMCSFSSAPVKSPSVWQSDSFSPFSRGKGSKTEREGMC